MCSAGWPIDARGDGRRRYRQYRLAANDPQLVTPNHLRGRMTFINMMFFMGGPQLGELEAGLLAAAIGAPLSVVIGGLGSIASSAVAVEESDGF